jgi:hypothetical protein
MKAFAKYFTMLTLALAMSFTLVSCGSDSSSDDPTPTPTPGDPNEVKFTTWKDTHTASDGSKITYLLKFAATTATYDISYTEGTQTVTETLNFSFTRSENLVILNPAQAGIATLEGRIENGIRMSLRNASTGSEIAVLYKQN